MEYHRGSPTKLRLLLSVYMICSLSSLKGVNYVGDCTREYYRSY